MPAVLAYAMEVLNVLPSLISTGSDVLALLDHANVALKDMQNAGRDPSNEEWDALHKVINDLRAQRPDV